MSISLSPDQGAGTSPAALRQNAAKRGWSIAVQFKEARCATLVMCARIRVYDRAKEVKMRIDLEGYRNAVHCRR